MFAYRRPRPQGKHLLPRNTLKRDSLRNPDKTLACRPHAPAAAVLRVNTSEKGLGHTPLKRP